MTNEPISQLDECLDALAVALQEVRDLADLVAGLRAYEAALGLVSISDPQAASAMGIARVWSALSATAEEILKLREVANGNT